MRVEAQSYDMRADERVAIRLPCTLETSEATSQGVTTDLSLGGVGVEFEAEENADFDTVHRVSIEGVGSFETDLRWVNSKRIGMAFKTEDARDTVSDYLESLGISFV